MKPLKSEESPEKEYSTTSDMLLMVTAGIWGFAFVAQRIGMDYMGPFAFNAIRFALGALVILPLAFRNSRFLKLEKKEPGSKKTILFGGLAAGLILFTAASFQQMGVVHTTAGNAGFITGLYVVIVPIMGVAFKKRTNLGAGLGALLAVVGLFLLSVTDELSIHWGDLLVLVSAFFWAAHVLIIGWLSPKSHTFKLAVAQFAICSLLSSVVALGLETTSFEDIQNAAVPILYGGLLSVGIAYTLQVFVQKKAHPSHVAIILSMESVFAVIGGWLILGEVIPARGIAGCTLMMGGMLTTQLWGIMIARDKSTKTEADLL